MHRERRRNTDGRVALILEDVQNPFNVGAIVRTAAAMGVDHVWLVGATPPLSHPKVQKTALGTQRYLTWTTTEVFADAVDRSEGRGLRRRRCRTRRRGASHCPSSSSPMTSRSVMGHEDRGLSKVALALCDQIAYVPQLGKVASLNVGTAAAIAIYEIRRRAWPAAPAVLPPDSCSRKRHSVAESPQVVQWGSDPEGVDGDAEAAGRAGRGGEGVEQGLVLGGAQQPLAVGRAQDVDTDRVDRMRP